eukprot:c33564_g1_i1.p2 GENE.c33564_g1_i1~~c33564_g1_i1.p2  ORF type:complete len:166 (+),score=25.79 c33564_g1_i1:31-528(+)
MADQGYVSDNQKIINGLVLVETTASETFNSAAGTWPACLVEPALLRTGSNVVFNLMHRGKVDEVMDRFRGALRTYFEAVVSPDVARKPAALGAHYERLADQTDKLATAMFGWYHAELLPRTPTLTPLAAIFDQTFREAFAEAARAGGASAGAGGRHAARFAAVFA